MINENFFSNKNTSNLLGVLCNQLGASSKKGKDFCKILLNDSMQKVFSSNRDKLHKGDPRRILKALNQKTIEQCAKKFEERRRSTGGSLERDRSLHGDRPVEYTQHPRSSQSRKQEGFAGMTEGDNLGYAPVPGGNTGFIGANGEMGKSMPINAPNQFGYNDKQMNKESLEREYMKREAEYNGGIGGNMGGMGGNMGGMGSQLPGVPMGMNRPPELNFALDGSDTRGYGNHDTIDSTQQGFGSNSYGGHDANQGYSNQFGGMSPEMMQNMGYGNQFGGMNSGMMQGMNPGMMQGMMQGMNQGMMQQDSQNYNSGKMDQTDFNRRLNQLTSTRNDIANPRGEFNPMMSPNQMNQSNQMNQMNQMNPMMMQQMMGNMNNSNFQMGGRGGTVDIVSELAEKKLKLAQRCNLDPESIATMDADSIGIYINNLKEQSKRKYESDSESDADPSEKKLYKNKKEKLKRLRELLEQKKQMVNKSKNLNKYVKSSVKKLDSDDSDNSDNSDNGGDDSDNATSDAESDADLKGKSKGKSRVVKRHPVKKSDKKQGKQINNKRRGKKQEDSDSEDSDNSDRTDSDVESDKPNNNDKKSKVNDSRIININSQKLCNNPKDYSDYLIDIDSDPIKNVTHIDIKDAKFPGLVTKITEKNNKLKLCVGNKPVTLEIDEGIVNMKVFAEQLSSSLQQDGYNVKIMLLGSGHTKIYHLNNIKLELDCTGDSILKEFGFKKNNYKGETGYISEGINKLHWRSYYMYIESIYEDKPFYEIINGGKIKKLIDEFDTPVECVNALIVKFKDEEGNIVEFDGNAHSYTLELKKQ